MIPEIQELGDACCGCGACAAVCPVQCIEMERDPAGFLYPRVDLLTCIGCQCCDMICPSENRRPADQACEVAWMQSKSSAVLARASSGGVFGELAAATLEEGGTVYGAVFDGAFKKVKHARASSTEELEPLLVSKYVQSSIGEKVYAGVREDLADGLPVLFSGTACEISGLLGFLSLEHADATQLLTAEVVCHGVPSPRLWEAWVEHLELEEGGRLKSVSFRDKSTGWKNFSSKYVYADGAVKTIPHKKVWYMQAFLRNAALRPSCFECPSKRSCGSDLTIGDFWGFAELHPDIDCAQGVSAVIANTAAGEIALEAVRDRFVGGPATYDEVERGNSALVRSVNKPEMADAFLADVGALGSEVSLEQLMEKWPFKRTLRQKVASRLGSMGAKLLRPRE